MTRRIKIPPVKRGSARESTGARKPFPIVGIGASAGGVEAFIALLKNLVTDTGMGFVVVQHLDRQKESRLTDILDRATAMPVGEAVDGVEVKPNHVYVIPSDRRMTISGGRLRLTRRREHETLINDFFSALAHDQKEWAIGVILSGTGTDGTLGLQAIKAADGITFCEDEASARYSAMPASASASGVVDFTLSPDKIALELARIAERIAGAADEKVSDGLRGILHVLREQTRVDFSRYKRSTIRRRIARRMVLKGVNSEAEYLEFLLRHHAEADALLHDVLINVTRFFRDPLTFQVLQKKVFPELVRNRAPNAPLRIWVPGCSTGEEVYSIAILLTEFLEKKKLHHPVQVYATDISERTIGVAREGLYPKSIRHDVTPERMRAYFTRRDGGYQINKNIRERCIFARHDVTTDPPFPRIDLISCRNLLIYFDPELQKRVIPVLHFALGVGGFLLLGTSESIGSFSSLFSVFDRRHKIFEKKAVRATRLTFPPTGWKPTPETRPPEETSFTGEMGVRKYGDRVLLKRLDLSGVLIDSEMRVLQFRGRTGFYLEHATGEATLDLLKMVHPDLLGSVRQAIRQATETQTPAKKTGSRFDHNGQRHDVSIEVIPFRAPSGRELFLHVLFQSVATRSSTDGKSAAVIGVDGAAVQDGHHSGNRDAMESLLEDKEIANEALQAANEEIQAINEEIQSSNEELETAKEELQSSNEELTTLNDELNNRNSELLRLNNDLTNLFHGLGIPVLMLGLDLRLRHFSPQAEQVLGLKKSDLGYHISALNMGLEGLARMAQQVVRVQQTREKDLRHGNGHYYSLKLRPYLSVEGLLDGVVIFLINIDEVKKAEDELHGLNSALETRVRQQDAVANLSQRALEGRPFSQLLQEVSAFVPKLLKVDHCKILEFDPETKSFLLRQGAGWKNGFVGKLKEPAERNTPDGFALVSQAPVIVEDFRTETRFDGSPLHHAHDIVSGISVVIPGERRPYGVLGACSTKEARFSREDASFLLSVANILAVSLARRQLETDLLAVSSTEQRRLGQDLHDGLAQQLAGVKFLTELAAKKPITSPTMKKDILAIADAIHEAILQTRMLARGLSPVDVEPSGLMAALRELVENTRKLFHVACTFRCTGPVLVQDGSMASHLYRVVQEAIQNAIKHGKASRITVTLSKKGPRAVLTVKDNGRGMPAKAGETSGMGLRIMNYRVRTIGGTLTVSPVVGGGTKVVCVFKWNAGSL